MMSRQTYNAVAAVLKDTWEAEQSDQAAEILYQVRLRFIQAFKKDNPAFNAGAFKKATGFTAVEDSPEHQAVKGFSDFNHFMTK